MRFLLLGGTGQVGTELRSLASAQKIKLIAPGRDQADLMDAQTIGRMVRQGPWDGVINAAAYTQVDRAESEQSIAFAVNGEMPTRLAEETGQGGIPLIQISTDYVFDGRKGAPYVETDRTAPLNVYGKSKLLGEAGVRAGNPRHVILRTSWIYSPFGANFVKTILRLAGERERLTVISDQCGCPTAARDVARACLDTAMHCAAAPTAAPYGVYHYAGAGDTTWHEFAQAIVDVTADARGRSIEVVPIATADYPTPVTRPSDTRLDCTAIKNAFGIQPRPWRKALAETIKRLLSNEDIP